ncbi:VOC family protein [Micromonospora sp. WMMD1102]|uniref:VOC family protein n=1 Tax=Micromonospora sp. WMMD1102 TaxID=3016105 RepID=UPI00241561BB|nr:VOC family protein [Micromonospora sp. WMMD1102]MDG4791613.1 VOC family protein [Micromonospora sp. WMMD1102]
MHRSRTYAVIIDIPEAEVGAGSAFWSGVFGTPARPEPNEPEFRSLRGAIPGLVTAIQSVDADARYHLDIETDDVAAEVARLVALGATEVAIWQECHVLRAPGGHLLCVIPVQSDPEVFRAEARSWPDQPADSDSSDSLDSAR